MLSRGVRWNVDAHDGKRDTLWRVIRATGADKPRIRSLRESDRKKRIRNGPEHDLALLPRHVHRTAAILRYDSDLDDLFYEDQSGIVAVEVREATRSLARLIPGEQRKTARAGGDFDVADSFFVNRDSELGNSLACWVSLAHSKVTLCSLIGLPDLALSRRIVRVCAESEREDCEPENYQELSVTVQCRS